MAECRKMDAEDDRVEVYESIAYDPPVALDEAVADLPDGSYALRLDARGERVEAVYIVRQVRRRDLPAEWRDKAGGE